MIAGCGTSGGLMPDEPGMQWTYDVRTGFGAGHVAEVRVARRLSVAGSEGFELAGALGNAQFAWRDGTLWVDRLSNVRLNPPAPLLRKDRQRAAWTGKLETPFGTESAKADLAHTEEKIKIAGRTFEAVRSELRLERNLGTTTLLTWFAPGVGIVRQEQRTRGALDFRLEWVAGPVRKSS